MSCSTTTHGKIIFSFSQKQTQQAHIIVKGTRIRMPSIIVKKVPHTIFVNKSEEVKISLANIPHLIIAKTVKPPNARNTDAKQIQTQLISNLL